MCCKSFYFQFITICFVLFVSSCQTGNQNHLLINNVDGDNLIQKMADYLINVENATEIDLRSFDLSDKQISNADLFIDTMWYIPLETSEKCLIGETQKIELDHRSVFVLDKYNAKSIFRFALSGEFLNQIGKKGHGPGEYGEVSDFSLLENKVAVYDHHKNKIHYYTKDGIFLYDKSLPFFCSQFVYLSSGSYLFYTFSAFNHHIPEIRDYNLLLCDTTFRIKRRGIKVDKDNKLRINSNAIRILNRQTYYNQFCNDTVYLISDEAQIQSKYIFQLKKNIPTSLFKKGDEGNFYRKVKDYYSFSSIDAVTNEHLIFRIKGQGNVQYMFVYSKITGKSYYGISFKGDKQLNPAYIKSLTSLNDTIIGLYQTELIKQTNRNNPNLSPILKKLVENTPEINNPILTFFKLRKF